MRTRGPQFHSHATNTFSKVAGLIVDCLLRHGRRTLPDVSEHLFPCRKFRHPYLRTLTLSLLVHYINGGQFHPTAVAVRCTACSLVQKGTSWKGYILRRSPMVTCQLSAIAIGREAAPFLSRPVLVQPTLVGFNTSYTHDGHSVANLGRAKSSQVKYVQRGRAYFLRYKCTCALLCRYRVERCAAVI